MNYLIYKIGKMKMKKSDTVKKAIVSMLNDYQDIKNMQWFLNHADKKPLFQMLLIMLLKISTRY